MNRLSIVVPVLDEEAGIVDALLALAPLRAAGAEVVVVDGGSSDRTVAFARPLTDRLLSAPRGRGSQMNAGAASAGGDLLLFLHADTRLPPDADGLIRLAIDRGHAWGRFDVRIASRRPALRLVAAAMNLRSRLTGIATGDQGMFVSRTSFDAAGGFPDLPLMEDIVLSRRLRRQGRPACLREMVSTSGRRWEHHGVWRTILTMWWLRWRFYCGADAARLARAYGYAPREP